MERGSFRELRLLYSKLDHGVRAGLVSKFTNSAEEDERQLQAQKSISSWMRINLSYSLPGRK